MSAAHYFDIPAVLSADAGGGGGFVIGVSGGIDSITLADMLCRQGLTHFAIAHCNFHLRGGESDGDAEFVRNWAAERGVKFHCIDFDTAGYAASRKISIEMAARELRYGWFSLLCRREGYRAVAIAHNANDNAETLILNLVRGTGLRGICGMQTLSTQNIEMTGELRKVLKCGDESLSEAQGCTPEDLESGRTNPCSASLRIWRPLLSLTRRQIEGYAVKHGLQWREDRTNRDSEHKRNLIRNEIIPLLERLNPAVVKVLNRDMRHFNEVKEIVDGCFGDGAPKPSVLSHSESVSPSGELFPDGNDLRQDGSLVERIVTRGSGWRYALYLFLEKYSFNSAVIGQVEDLLESSRTVSGKTFFSPTHSLVMTGSSLIITPLNREPEPRSLAESFPAGTPGAASGEFSGVAPVDFSGMIPDDLSGVAPVDFSRVVPADFSGVVPVDLPGETSRGQSGELVVTSPGEYQFNGCTVKVELLDRSEDFDVRQPEGVTAVSADILHFPLILRTWRSGDWMRPLGCRGRKKVSDLFTDLKFSLPEKRRAIFLASGEGLISGKLSFRTESELSSGLSSGKTTGGTSGASSRVLALLGRRIDESVRITPETRRLLRFTVTNPSNLAL